jgi:RNA polymerase sigma-70 factor (ECF subfamily)
MSDLRTTTISDSLIAHDCADRFVATISCLRSFARALTRNIDLADELVRDTLAKGWELRQRVATGISLRAWLLCTLRELFYRDGCREKGSCLCPTQDDDLAMTGSSTPQNSNDTPDELIRACSQLDAGHREVLMLVGILDLGYVEAATVLDCPESSLRVRLWRARLELEKRLGQT